MVVKSFSVAEEKFDNEEEEDDEDSEDNSPLRLRYAEMESFAF